MSAAPSFPYEDDRSANNAAATLFTINSTFTPTPHQGVILGVGQTIQFKNNSGAAISLIEFMPNPLVPPSGPGPTLYTNVTNLANQATSPVLTPSPTVGSVNYFIYDANNNQYGPFSIQLGVAVPLNIQIIGAESHPAIAAVPQNGKVIMYSDDQPCDPGYEVSWSGGNGPLNPILQTPSCGFQNTAIRSATGNAGTYLYNTAINTPGGRVIVQN